MSIFKKALGMVGLGGEQGDYYKNPALNSLSKQQLDKIVGMQGNKDANALVSGVAGGDMNLAEILAGAEKTGDQQNALSYLASSPVAGSALAAQQVQEDPNLAALFGDGGSMDMAAAEEARLLGQGYKLQPEDYEAYGQASGDIARDFGMQEQSLANALAARGMSSSGAAGAQFSGMYGNKFEQLAKLQTDIADRRMQNTLQRVTQTRNHLANLGALSENAQGQRFAQNNQRTADLQKGQALDTTQYGAEQQAAQASQASKDANAGLSLKDVLGQGISSGVNGLFKSGAASLGGSLFGGSEPTVKGNQAGGGAAKKPGTLWA